MFEPEKERYLTRGVDETIPVEIQLFMWQAIDQMPEPKDYLHAACGQGLTHVHRTQETLFSRDQHNKERRTLDFR